LIFYAYCGGNTDDAIALDNIVLTPASFDGKDE
jgi:hypothetical protein